MVEKDDDLSGKRQRVCEVERRVRAAIGRQLFVWVVDESSSDAAIASRLQPPAAVVNVAAKDCRASDADRIVDRDGLSDVAQRRAIARADVSRKAIDLRGSVPMIPLAIAEGLFVTVPSEIPTSAVALVP